MSRNHRGRASGRGHTTTGRRRPSERSGNVGANARRELEEQLDKEHRALVAQLKELDGTDYRFVLTAAHREGTLSTDSIEAVSRLASMWVGTRLLRALAAGEPCRQAVVKIEVALNPGEDMPLAFLAESGT